MKFKQFPQILLLIIASLFLLMACSSTDEPSASNTTSENHDDSNNQHGDNGMMTHADVPEEYSGMTNPLSADDEEALSAGQLIFQTNCVACHGEKGNGDGVAAAGLDPKPANLADGMMMSMAGDDYLFWRVREGGGFEPFNSAMPSWKSILSEEETWQVVNYVRSLSN